MKKSDVQLVIRVTPAVHRYTDKKEKKTFLIYKEIQIGSVAKVIYEDGLLKNAQIYNCMCGDRQSYMTLQPIPSEFPYM